MTTTEKESKKRPFAGNAQSLVGFDLGCDIWGAVSAREPAHCKPSVVSLARSFFLQMEWVLFCSALMRQCQTKKSKREKGPTDDGATKRGSAKRQRETIKGSAALAPTDKVRNASAGQQTKGQRAKCAADMARCARVGPRVGAAGRQVRVEHLVDLVHLADGPLDFDWSVIKIAIVGVDARRLLLGDKGNEFVGPGAQIRLVLFAERRRATTVKGGA